jgi:hypothetical protein
MKLPSIIATLLTACLLLFIASSSMEAKDPPAFPGQPRMNGALRHLNAAKDKAPTDAPGAIDELQAAAGTLSHAKRNKGTYSNIARQLTDEATEYLKKGDVEKAVQKINEAITAVDRGGDTGDH